MSESDYTRGPDGVAEQEAILDRLRSNLVGGRVYDQITDEQIEAMGSVREIAPYIMVDFGQPTPTRGDRILALGELDQPYVMGISVNCWGSKTSDLRRVAGAVRRLLIDWAPNDTCQPIAGFPGLSGGGFGTTSARVQLPSRERITVTLMLTFNLGIPEPA